MSKLKTDIHTKFLDVYQLSSLNMIASYKWDGKTAANTIINQYYDEVKKLKAMKVNWWITLSLFIEKLFRVMAENQHQKKSSYLLSSVWFLSPAPLPTVKLPLAACQSQFTRVTSQIIIWNRKCFRDPLTRSPLATQSIFVALKREYSACFIQCKGSDIMWRICDSPQEWECYQGKLREAPHASTCGYLWVHGLVGQRLENCLWSKRSNLRTLFILPFWSIPGVNYS